MAYSHNQWAWLMVINTMIKNVGFNVTLADLVPKNVSTNNRLVQKVGPELFEKMGSTNIGDIYKDKFRENQLYVK